MIFHVLVLLTASVVFVVGAAVCGLLFAIAALIAIRYLTIFFDERAERRKPK